MFSTFLCRNFYYITMLRDPVSRYLSEWKHVQRGATWKTALHMCDGRPPTQDELPACYSGEDWTGVPLADFMNCPSNLANNRQVRMLADLSLVGCYNMSSISELERGRVLLASAKANLRNMAFYGLTEFQRKTQYLFERTFGLRFIRPFTQINSTRAASVGISEKVRWRIEGLNALDMELYEYAKELFQRRYQYNRQKQHQEERVRRWQERKQKQQLHRTYLAQLLRLGGGAEEEEEGVKAREEVTTTEDYSSQVVRWWGENTQWLMLGSLSFTLLPPSTFAKVHSPPPCALMTAKQCLNIIDGCNCPGNTYLFSFYLLPIFSVPQSWSVLIYSWVCLLWMFLKH